MQNAARSDARVAVLFLDLDGFKQVNDEHGHEAGDAVLCALAQRTLESIRECDTLARKGGDEFFVILEGLQDVTAASVVAERIVEAVARPVAYHDRLLRVGVSVGLAVSPDHGQTVETLLRSADAAMYAAKRSGRSRVEVGIPVVTERVAGAL